MTAGKYDFTLEQGATFNKQLVWKENGTPLDLSGYTARMQVKKTPKSTTNILDLTTSNGGIVIDGANGKVTLIVSATDSAALKAGSYVYDLELEETATSDVTRLLQGCFEINAEVTK